MIRHVAGDDDIVVDAHAELALELAHVAGVETVVVIDVIIINGLAVVIIPVVELDEGGLAAGGGIVVLHVGDNLRQEEIEHGVGVIVFKIREVALEESVHLRAAGRAGLARLTGSENAGQDRHDHDQCSKAAQQTDEQLLRLVLRADLRRGDPAAGRRRIPVALALGRFGRGHAADGAKSHQLVTKITIPMIAPTTFFVFLMELIYSFKIFREVFALFGDYPNTNVYFLQNFINNNYYNLNYPRLSAASIVLSLFIIIVLFIFFCFERKHSYS